MWQLYLDDIEIELANQGVAITKQANNFSELKDRQATFTNLFKALETPKNIATFKDLGIVGNESRTPYTKLSVLLTYASVPIVSNGYAIIGGRNNGFEISIYDGNIHFFNAILSKKVQELSLSDLDHELTNTEFINSFTNTTGYIYAIADFGNFKPEKIEINYQLPSIYVKTLWDRIFNEASFTKDFTPEDDLVITAKRGYNSEIDSVTSPLNVIATATFSFDDPGSGSPLVTRIFKMNFTPDQSHTVDGKVTITEDANYSFSVDVDFTYDNPSQVTNESLIMRVNGSDTLMHDVSADIFVSTTPWIRTSLFTGDINLMPGDEVEFFYKFNHDSSLGSVNDLVQYTSDFNFTSGSVVLNVILNTFIGEMSQSDFVKDVMQHYGLTMVKTKDSQEYKFIKAKDLLTDTANAEDWSDIFISQSGEDYSLSGYAQSNKFAYSYRDSNEIPYADGYLELDNDTLKPEFTQLTRPYDAPNTSPRLLNSNLLLKMPFWEAERDDNGIINGYKVLNGKNYIAKIEINSESIDYGLTDGTTNTHTGTIPRLKFTGLKYQELLESNYVEIKQMLDWNRVIDVTVKMDAFDFDDLDLITLKYIKQLGGYFYLNKAKFKGGETVEVELINVPQ